MNSKDKVQFPTADTVLNALVVCGMTVACALLVVSQGFQAVVA